MVRLLRPRQLGVGVSGGAEAAVHVARQFLDKIEPGQAMFKIDFKNAFNSLRRDTMLETVRQNVPEIYNFCWLSYATPSELMYAGRLISSSEGNQQGDNLGALLFSLTVHPILTALESDIVMGYLDDFSGCGSLDAVARDVALLERLAAEMGLSLNVSKCEIITLDPPESLPGALQDFVYLSPGEASLLGAPILTGTAMDAILEKKCSELRYAISRFSLITAHDALLILKNAMGACKLLYIMRASPCSDHRILVEFDGLMRFALSGITNCDVTEVCWIQASLPVASGGLGIRSVVMLAPSAFLASAAATLCLQEQLLPAGRLAVPDRHRDSTLNIWSDRYHASEPPASDKIKQRKWDAASISKGIQILCEHYSEPFDKARLLACQAPHSGDWLNAWPITACGLRLNDETIRVAVGLRLGINLCSPHQCPCGVLVDARGTHGLSCRRSSGRIARHNALNDIVHRAFIKAGVQASKEPTGLVRSDGKRPDGATQIPWVLGRCLAWDVTIPDTMAASHLPKTSVIGGAAAETASERKTAKYAGILRTHDFCPVACETLGPINEAGLSLFKALGRRLTTVTGDPREGCFLLQRVSIIIQKGNAIAFGGSFPNNLETGN